MNFPWASALPSSSKPWTCSAWVKVGVLQDSVPENEIWRRPREKYKPGREKRNAQKNHCPRIVLRYVRSGHIELQATEATSIVGYHVKNELFYFMISFKKRIKRGWKKCESRLPGGWAANLGAIRLGFDGRNLAGRSSFDEGSDWKVTAQEAKRYWCQRLWFRQGECGSKQYKMK